MFLRTIHIDNNVFHGGGMEEQLSLWPFIKKLQQNILQEDDNLLIPKIANQLILDKIQQFGDIEPDNFQHYQELFELIYHYAKGVPQANQVNWALGWPIPDRVFFGTKGFYNLLEGEFIRMNNQSGYHYLDFEFANKQLLLLVLERFYGLPPLHQKLRYIKKSEEFNQYYELHIDYSYVEVTALSELPLLDLASLKGKDNLTFTDIAPIIEAFDLSKFSFKGFTICTFEDCQHSYISEQLQSIINNLSIYKGEDGLQELNKLLSHIVGYKNVKTSFYPILKLNDIPVISPDFAKNSMLFKEEVFYDQDIMNGEILKYLDNPSIISFGIQDGLDSPSSKLKKSLQKTGLQSYICFPLLQQNNIVGVFELYGINDVVLSRNMLIQVREFYNLLAQLASGIVTMFKSELNNVILHQYTSLQPAVEWRFNQVAATYLGDLLADHGEPQPEKIVFNKVFPFYGAIDVKDSSFLRNKSYRDDILIRVLAVNDLLEEISQKDNVVDYQSFVDKFNSIKSWTNGKDLDNYILDILAFFQEDVSSFLDQIGAFNILSKARIKTYVQRIQFNDLSLNSSNEAFEHSLQKINQLVKTALNDFNQEVQSIFPSYFETFRTDGIEYDLYVGQSITPRVTFKPTLLKQFRRMQIENIARIGQQTHKLKKSLKIPLETTQLVFIHPNPIDISFREDERRFDVEGSYNIRYQIIKKRIDKAVILNSSERLVKPGFIAIVYSRNDMVNELKACLKDVAKLGLISSDIEEHSIENLQGVSDLKALRVRILLDDN